MIKDKILYRGTITNESYGTSIKDIAFGDVMIEEISDIVFENVSFKGDLTTLNNIVISNCKFINCTMTNFNIHTTAMLENCEFENCIIDKFIVNNINDCKFTNCNMFIHSPIDPLSINDTKFTKCNILHEVSSTKQIIGCTYIDSTVSRLILKGRSYIIKTSFENCIIDRLISESDQGDLTLVSFIECDIGILVIENTRMIKTRFENCVVEDRTKSKIKDNHSKCNDIIGSGVVVGLLSC